MMYWFQVEMVGNFDAINKAGRKALTIAIRQQRSYTQNIKCRRYQKMYNTFTNMTQCFYFVQILSYSEKRKKLLQEWLLTNYFVQMTHL